MTTDTMYALTLWQPWLGAILRDGKRVENRPWKPPSSLIGQRIALHAGMKWDAEGAAIVRRICTELPGDEMMRGAVLGVAKVVQVLRYKEPLHSRLVDDPWACGPYCWILGEVVELPKPVPCRGYQRLWHLSPEDNSEVLKQLAK